MATIIGRVEHGVRRRWLVQCGRSVGCMHEVLAGADPQAEILHVVHSHGLSSEGASVRDIVETVAAFVLLTVAAIVVWRGPW